MVLGGRDPKPRERDIAPFSLTIRAACGRQMDRKEKSYTQLILCLYFFSETTLSNVSRRFPLNSMKLSCMGEYNPINESSFIEHELCVSQSHFSNWEDSKDNSRRICLSSKSMLLIFSRMNYFPLDLWGNF